MPSNAIIGQVESSRSGSVGTLKAFWRDMAVKLHTPSALQVCKLIHPGLSAANGPRKAKRQKDIIENVFS